MSDFDVISDKIRKAQEDMIDSLTSLTGDKYETEITESDDLKLKRSNNYWSSNVIEKGGIHFIKKTEEAKDFIKKMGMQVDGTGNNHENVECFSVTGSSLILHPKNPHVPTIHMNVRYFEVGNTWWFGGGIDISPSYFYPSDIKKFHFELKNICDEFGMNYEKFKLNCDEYFFLKSRQQTRGLGGIFFDYLNLDKQQCLGFILKLINELVNIYSPFLEYKDKPYTDIERNYSLLRRGIYAEFIYLYDKGIKFGFDAKIPIKSMFSSLPPLIKYEDEWKLTDEQKKLDAFFSQRIDWINYKD